MSDTLGEALPREMARVRDEVLPAYIEIGGAGSFAAAGMRVEMIRVYKSLKEWET